MLHRNRPEPWRLMAGFLVTKEEARARWGGEPMEARPRLGLVVARWG